MSNNNLFDLSNLNDKNLLKYYLENKAYRSNFSNKGFATDFFLERYHRSLFYYKHYYDDIYEYGNKSDCREVIYFIPGFNGTPGQVRFGLPGIIKKYGNKIYIKCLYLDEFSCKYPYWLKYNEGNLEKRRDRIVEDIFELVNYGKKVRVFVSSTAFYDFLSVYPRIKEVKKNIVLYWGSCAPDSVIPSKWGRIFSHFNGFTVNNMKWYSYPVHRWLNVFNPECADRHYWKYNGQQNTFWINDIESRFFLFGILWDYASTDCFNFFINSNLRNFRKNEEKLDMDVHILAGTKDGFWDDSSRENIEKTINKYIVKKRIIYKKKSHLWLVTPDNINELLNS